MLFSDDAGTPSIDRTQWVVVCLKHLKAAGGGSYRGSATGEAQWPISPPPQRWAGESPPGPTPLDKNGGQPPGLRCRGARVKTQAGNVTGECGEANKRSTDSKPLATGGSYPIHNRRSLVSILGSREIPSSGSREKIETLESH